MWSGRGGSGYAPAGCRISEVPAAMSATVRHDENTQRSHLGFREKPGRIRINFSEELLSSIDRQQSHSCNTVRDLRRTAIRPRGVTT
jgi:hypothetical protein